MNITVLIKDKKASIGTTTKVEKRDDRTCLTLHCHDLSFLFIHHTLKAAHISRNLKGINGKCEVSTKALLVEVNEILLEAAAK